MFSGEKTHPEFGPLTDVTRPRAPATSNNARDSAHARGASRQNGETEAVSVEGIVPLSTRGDS